MAVHFNLNCYDEALNYIKNNATHLHIIKTAQPTTWAEATGANDLGYKASPGFTGPAAGDVSGRKLTVSAITDGVVSATGTAAYVAITDDTDELLLATYELNATKSVESGDTFSLTAFKLTFPEPS